MSNKDLNRKPFFIFVTSAILASMIGILAHFLAFNTFSSKAELKENGARTLASVKNSSMSKELVLNSKAQLRKRFSGKVRAQILTTIEKDPSSDKDILILNGVIHSVKAIDRLNIKWVLPDDAELISGQIQDELFNVEKSKDIQIQIRLKNKSTNQRVFLHAFQVINGENHGNVAQFNSVENSVGTLKAGGAKSDFKIDPSKQTILQ